MKTRLIVLATFLMFCGISQAQNQQNHWSFNYHDFEHHTYVLGRAYYNGELLNSPNIEIAAFTGDVVCGDSYLYEYLPQFLPGQYFVDITVFSNTSGQVVTFKAYDHDTGIEYDLYECETTVITGDGNSFGNIDTEVLTMNFSYEEPPTYGPDYPWNPTTAYANNMSITAQIQINGVPVTTPNWEVGAFCGDECRGDAGADNMYSVTGHPEMGYFMDINIWGETEGDIINFYLYDIENATVFAGVCNATVAWENDGNIGDIFEPFILDFVTEQTFTKNITAYTEGEKDHYYLIASPIGGVSPEDVTNMLSNTYDLYYFDQASDLEWITYKPSVGATDPGFNLVSGKGYLYANSGTATQPVTTLTFTGYPTYGEAEVTLTKNNDASIEFPGWNLVGNPLAEPAYIGTKAYYRMNGNAEDGGDEIVTALVGTAIDVMEGIFVVADTDEETLTFSTEQPGKCAALAMNITRDRGYAIDRAIVRFDNGQALPKFQLNANSTKLYIPQDTKEYAVVSAGNEGEIPVNFKAEKNGTYTIGFSAQDIDFRYLHLIDNKTGNDIDLLENPSYSFDALTTDYASRFKLVFVCGDASDDSFTFFNGSSWFINNEGKATLQVIDVTGRILKSENISGCAYVNIDEAPGVYMVRLIKGENVKVQKIVVK